MNYPVYTQPQPTYPQAPAPYPQQYAQPPAQQFMPGVPAPYAAPQAPAQPLATGTLDDFFSQPSAGGGKSLSFKVIGTTFVGIVTRPLGPGDVRQQTNTAGVPQFYKDGRPKFAMTVPLQMQPSPDFPDGLATWWVKGQARDELVRAMAEAGAPAGAPEAGAVIQVTYVGDRAAGAGFNPAKQFQVVYQRPQGAVPQAASHSGEAPQQPAVAQYPAPVAAPPVTEAPQVQYVQQAAPPVAPEPAMVPQAVAQAPAPVAQPQPVAQAPLAPQVTLSAEQQELLARMTAGS